MKKTWIQVDGELIPKEEYVPKSRGPMIMGDIKPYRNVIDGKMITSRSKHREFLKQHGCIEVGNEKDYFTRHNGKTEDNARGHLDRYTHHKVMSELMRK